VTWDVSIEERPAMQIIYRLELVDEVNHHTRLPVVVLTRMRWKMKLGYEVTLVLVKVDLRF
jgi:hypothetical protein